MGRADLAEGQGAVREKVMKLLAGGPLEWPARDAYYRWVNFAPRVVLGSNAAQGRTYDRLTVQIAAQALAAGGGCIDVGANAGQILRKLLRVSPDGLHWAFEPIPRYTERLRRKFPEVTVSGAALSDHTGVADFHYYPGDPAYSSLLNRPRIADGKRGRTLRVNVQRLDDCIPENMPVRFIKIDVEGAEDAVLRGATRTLSECRPVVVFECDPANLDNCVPVLEQAGLRISLLADYAVGVKLDSDEAMQAGRERGEFYYVASKP